MSATAPFTHSISSWRHANIFVKPTTNSLLWGFSANIL